MARIVALSNESAAVVAVYAEQVAGQIKPFALPSEPSTNRSNP